MAFDSSHIRNFSIIAHIDHGKSTLADRILEKTGAVDVRQMKEQFLDSMDLERERGITIKLNAVSLTYKAKNGEEYLFNLIDTPGHVDFSYEVSRSLAACEGALLLVDATQGVQAQTLANLYLALDDDLAVLPIINKIDLPSADIAFTKKDIESRIGLDCSTALEVSAKTGEGVEEILERIITDIPAPSGEIESPLKALVFDSYYDPYRGVILLVRIKEGNVKVGQKITLMNSRKNYEVTEVGIRTPKEENIGILKAGEVGYIAATIKDIKDVFPGETVTGMDDPANEPLPGYRRINPMVYCGLYPVLSKDYENLKEAIAKLALNDSSLLYVPETSQALGFGFRCGFLGLLHMDVVQERLEREYGLDLILTAPSVAYQIKYTDRSSVIIDNPSALPDPSKIAAIEEPFVSAFIMAPTEYVGPIMELCQSRRGIYVNINYYDDGRVVVDYDLPLSEIIYNFFDKLKSSTKGYASLDYQFKEFKKGDLCKMDILLNGEKVDALSSIVYRPNAYKRGLAMVSKLKTIIPRQQFQVPIQAAISGKVIARADIKSVRKDVLAKCYGGDITRKKKLLEKQKEGKKRMKEVGSVSIPQDAFMALLSLDEEENS